MISRDFTISADRMLTIFIACAVALIGYKDMILSHTAINSTELAKLTVEVRMLNRTVSELKDFASKPRFTHDDSNKAMAVVNSTLSRHEATLKAREVWMREREEKERELFYKLKLMEQHTHYKRGNNTPKHRPLIYKSPVGIRREEDVS